MIKETIMITTGGTGGHVFPAISIAQMLSKKKYDTYFIGGYLDDNKFFNSKNLNFFSINCGKFVFKNPWQGIKNFYQIYKGFLQSLRILKAVKPKLVVGFGSYYTVPVLLAAFYLKIPYVLHEANSIPGKVNKLFAKKALWTGLHFSQTEKYIKGPVKHVGMPLRKHFKKNCCSKEEAFQYYDLNSSKKTILILGGSQGASSINNWMIQVAPLLPKNLQIIHFCGSKENPSLIKDCYEKEGIKAIVKSFENKMEYALTAADVAISRAGASSIAELMEFEIPTLFIPYPFAAENHQLVNADYYLTLAKGGVKMNEEQYSNTVFLNMLQTLLANQTSFQENIQLYKKTIGKSCFYEHLLTTLGETNE